jgi:hypothetical protein
MLYRKHSRGRLDAIEDGMNLQPFPNNPNPNPNPIPPTPHRRPAPPIPGPRPPLAGFRWTKLNPGEIPRWKVEKQYPDGTWTSHPSALWELLMAADMCNVGSNLYTLVWRAPNCNMEFHANYEQPGWLLEWKDPDSPDWIVCPDLWAALMVGMMPPPNPSAWT